MREDFLPMTGLGWAAFGHREIGSQAPKATTWKSIPLLVRWVRGRLSRFSLRPRTGSHARTAGRIGRRQFLTSQPPLAWRTDR